MGDRALENRIRKIKELEAQKKELDAQICALNEEIKQDMTSKQLEEHRTKNFIIRFKMIFSNSFDSKRFKAENPDLYAKYLVSGSCMRFTIS